MTLFLWLTSFVVIAMSFWRTKEWVKGSSHFSTKLIRFMFCIMTGTTFWAISTYLFWLLGFELEIHLIESGRMGEHWWLPPVLLLWTVISYYAAKIDANSSSDTK